MLSSDRSELRADHRRRPAARTYDDALWEVAQPFDPDAPWDDGAAEALMCLCESEEGRLSRPAAGNRVRPSLRQTVDSEPEAAESVDRAWLEAHLSRMAQRLHDALAQASPEPTLAALSGRLDTIEQRFDATLGRVAQRTDLDGLRAIEARVLELAAQLEQARDRLDRIGALDDEVRALARKLDEAGAQRASGLEKLMRDCIAEWREGEQRTASALQHIEEAVGRLGETVDAMEASKPAPDLTVPPLTGTELHQVAGANGALLHAGNGRTHSLYHSALDAADYAPRLFAGVQPAASSLPAAEAKAQQAPLDWSPDAGGEGGRPTGARLTAGALRIMALRAKLRQSNGNGRDASHVPAGAIEAPRHGTIKRAGLSVLLVAGAVLAATYYLYQTYVVAAATGQ
ncbi:MAG: hypothetical protein WAN86_15265 [Hyphomicrobiaceae bacterium]